MSTAPSMRHQKILGALFYRFYDYLKDKPGEVYCAPFDLRLPTGDEKEEDIQTVVQPDILVRDPNKLNERGCQGAPDLIIEIVSLSTAPKDMKEKFFLYDRLLTYYQQCRYNLLKSCKEPV